jgi:glucose-6-phosphate 1-dehydrogenase
VADSPADIRPTIFVLFGATGDLAKKLVLPAFYELERQGLLPETWRLVGNGRGDESHEEFRAHVREVLEGADVEIDEGRWEAFIGNVLFAGGGFTNDDPGTMLEVLGQAREDLDNPQIVHYIATPPVSFAGFTSAIGAHDLAKGSRVVYEKPYGTSPDGFRELDAAVHDVFEEEQVFRIDHFLGKEATQNLHVLRFANTLLGSIWDRTHIEQVQIDVPETLDITDRVGFYDATGAMLDMLVTHLFQVAAEVAMEPPTSMAAADLQAAREGVIAAFRPLDPNEVVLGQFEGYGDLDGVADGSQTDTFVAARLWIDTDRWQGVPFLLRTGKKLAVSDQKVSLVLRTPDGPLTHIPPHGNVVTLTLTGGGQLDVDLIAKDPGPDLTLVRGDAVMSLGSLGGHSPLPAYGALLRDVLTGDRSLFTTPEGLATAWAAVEPVLAHRPAVESYPAGSWGPASADALPGPEGWLLADES